MRTCKIDQITFNKIVFYHEKGLNIRDISKIVHVGHDKVSEILRKLYPRSSVEKDPERKLNYLRLENECINKIIYKNLWKITPHF